jgi:hypothetical protein
MIFVPKNHVRFAYVGGPLQNVRPFNLTTPAYNVGKPAEVHGCTRRDARAQGLYRYERDGQGVVTAVHVPSEHDIYFPEEGESNNGEG